MTGVAEVELSPSIAPSLNVPVAVNCCVRPTLMVGMAGVTAIEVRGTTLNVAVTDLAASIVTVHVPVPEQPAPLQPTKVEPTAGLAVRVTLTPLVKEATQVLPQLMPARLLVTVPLLLPVTTLLTDRV